MLKVSIKSSSSKQIKISSKYSKKKKKKCFIVKNKYLTVARGCFVPMTFIRQEVAIKGNSMQKNSGKQILRSLLKNERNHFKNQWYIA